MTRLFFILTYILMSFGANSEEIRSEDHYQKRVQSSHDILVLENGISALLRRLQLINEAKKSINVEYFIYNDDHAGRILTKALVKKAQQGVKVRLLLDKFMIGEEITPFYAHELRKNKVEVKYYNTFPLIRFSKYNYRNHRKNFIVDDRVAIVGGRNIGDDYFDLDFVYNFVDREIEVKGEIVKSISKTFMDTWNNKESKALERPAYPERVFLAKKGSKNRVGKKYRDHSSLRIAQRKWKKSEEDALMFMGENEIDNKIREYIEEYAIDLLAEEDRTTCDDISFYSDRPGLSKKRKVANRVLRDEIFKQMNKVQTSLLIDSPYFILDKLNKDIFESLLVEKKAKVTVFTNGVYSTDALYVQTAFNSLVRKWLRLGLEAYLHKGDIQEDYPSISPKVDQSRWGTHSKTLIFDNNTSYIGSYNMDPRSNYYSLEMGIFCYNNPKFASLISEKIKKRTDAAHFVDDVETLLDKRFDRTGPLKKIAYFLTLYPSLLLQKQL